MKYTQLNEKFFINVPILTDKQNLDYIDCYVYGYIHKKNNNFLNILKNLEISKYQAKKIISKLKFLNCIEEKNKIFYTIENQKNILFKFEDDFLYDRTYLPNRNFLSIIQNAIFWKLYKYADPVEGMNNYYTIGTKKDIKKIDYEYLSKVLKISLYSVKKSMRHLKNLNIIKIQTSKNSFYFGIQPLNENMKTYWKNEEKNVSIDQKTILNLYEV
jgi:hypothetical protein